MAPQRDTTPPTPEPLPVVPGLRVIEKIACGGQGCVYRAEQHDLDRTVALKVLEARLLDEGHLRRFEREKVALGRLSDHPSIVSLLDSGYTDSGAPYLLLEFAPGGSLADRIDESGALTVDEATALAVQMAAALERAHASGIVHCDIKPANILRSGYGNWMLTDFGIASLADRHATTTVHVSYGHTAPEIYAGAMPSPLADVYSLASVVATCLTGDQPFEVTAEEMPVSAMRRAATEPYPDLRRAGVPDALASLLERALSKDPGTRPVSALAFAQELNEVRASMGLHHEQIQTIADVDVAAATRPNATVAVDPDAMVERLGVEPMEDAPATPARPRRLRRALTAVAMVLALFGIGAVGSSVLDGVDGDDVVGQVAADEPDFASEATIASIALVDEEPDDDGEADVVPAQADDNDSDDGPGDGDGSDNGNGPGDGDRDGRGDGPGNGGRNGDGRGNGNGDGRGNGNG